MLQSFLIASCLAFSTIMFWQSKPKEFWKLRPKELAVLWGSEPQGPADWHTPQAACSLLDEIGLKTRAYKNYDPEYCPNDYACASPYKDISAGRPMPNNLAYYVTGDQHTAKELKLVLNVNDRSTAEDGHRALAIASGLLTKNALGTYLMKEVYTALIAGRADRWKAGKNKIEIIRDDWETGKGYEVHFIIR